MTYKVRQKEVSQVGDLLSRRKSKFQKNSLVHVEFTSTNFNNVSLKNLRGLYNLKYLRFENCEELEFLKIVLKYIERNNNNLKIFGMLGLDKEFNDEELNLLNQIKDKGVKIVEYYSFYNYL
ncbi:hypothetical protein RhiirA4_446594 [Rhizophagus irregularis]|uniref:Uncharacterized protein n=1 Tax=Rhizophagus irregularis TaxID=588596 RepID=A0A2I1GW88_9GLOM|nr:hypothetical protein RhiirA4_446594 [Rhizophagus irregularis]